MSDNQPTTPSQVKPYKPGASWKWVWNAITALGVGSWVYLAMRSYYDNGPIGFADNALVGFLTLTPVLGATAACTWLGLSALSRIEKNLRIQQELHHQAQLDRQEEHHRQTMEAIEKAKSHIMQQMWKAIAGAARRDLDLDETTGSSPGVVPMRRANRGS